jgi:hypothetical protein
MPKPDRSLWDELHQELARILWEEWDPICINEYPQTVDEYYNYVAGLVETLRAGGTDEDVTDYLRGVQRDSLGGARFPPYSNTQVAAIACVRAYRSYTAANET